MKFKTEIKVLGMKASKEEMDNGLKFDSTKVYVETQLDESKGNAKGFAVAEYTFGLSEQFEQFRHLPFPFLATAEMELQTNGKTQKTAMLSLEPRGVPAAAAPAKA